jgi:nicotinamidase-related amidase
MVIAGEAESHCVLESAEDLVDYYSARPEQLARIHILSDCTSPVQHPDIDFHAMALERFETFARQGLKFINSTDPLPF